MMGSPLASNSLVSMHTIDCTQQSRGHNKFYASLDKFQQYVEPSIDRHGQLLREMMTGG